MGIKEFILYGPENQVRAGLPNSIMNYVISDDWECFISMNFHWYKSDYELFQRTKIYPMTLRFFSPLSSEQQFATLPAVFPTFPQRWVPNPMKESGETQSFCWFAMRPKRTFEWEFEYVPYVCALNPSRLQLRCKDDPEINDFHLSRPSCVCR